MCCCYCGGGGQIFSQEANSGLPTLEVYSTCLGWHGSRIDSPGRKIPPSLSSHSAHLPSPGGEREKQKSLVPYMVLHYKGSHHAASAAPSVIDNIAPSPLLRRIESDIRTHTHTEKRGRSILPLPTLWALLSRGKKARLASYLGSNNGWLGSALAWSMTWSGPTGEEEKEEINCSTCVTNAKGLTFSWNGTKKTKKNTGITVQYSERSIEWQVINMCHP